MSSGWSDLGIIEGREYEALLCSDRKWHAIYGDKIWMTVSGNTPRACRRKLKFRLALRKVVPQIVDFYECITRAK